MKETENNDDNLESLQKFFQVDFVVSGFYLTFWGSNLMTILSL